MSRLIQRLTTFSAAFLGVTLLASADAPAPCVLTGQNLHIEVRSEPDDGAWGPTIEISVIDEMQPLSRMIVPESRPIEECWWTDIDPDVDISAPELIIGVGEDDTHEGGAIVFDWDGRQLQRRAVPALPVEASGTFRYVVSNSGLWAHPVAADSEAMTAGTPYRLTAGLWVAIRREVERSISR